MGKKKKKKKHKKTGDKQRRGAGSGEWGGFGGSSAGWAVNTLGGETPPAAG